MLYAVNVYVLCTGDEMQNQQKKTAIDRSKGERLDPYGKFRELFADSLLFGRAWINLS